MRTYTQHLNRLLDSDLEDILAYFPERENIVKSRLKSLEEDFSYAIKKLDATSRTEKALYSRLFEKLGSLEQEVVKHFPQSSPSNQEGLSTIAQNLLEESGVKEISTHYLSDSAIEEMLEKHPPLRLMEGLEVESLFDLYKHFSPRTSLALTRHTESEDWQEEYLRILKDVDSNSFAPLPVAVQVIDRNKHSKLWEDALLKPWLISHSKEAGVILCFTYPQEIYPTPLLLCALVFLHYVFETTAAGRSCSMQPPEKPLGKHTVYMITSGRYKYSFFTPNTYSENIFWKQAENVFFRLCHSKDSDFFSSTRSTGGYIDNPQSRSTVFSVNIIDALWSYNLGNLPRAHKYFAHTSFPFFYHFREALWSDIFAALLSIPEDVFEDKVMENLHLGDKPFTEKMVVTRDL